MLSGNRDLEGLLIKHIPLLEGTKSDDVQTRKIQTETGMVNQIAGILLVVALGLCVIAFPFVLWMLFSNGPRLRPVRRIARPRENGTSDFSG